MKFDIYVATFENGIGGCISMVPFKTLVPKEAEKLKEKEGHNIISYDSKHILIETEYSITDFEFTSYSVIHMLLGMRVDLKDTNIKAFENGKTFKISIESDAPYTIIDTGW